MTLQKDPICGMMVDDTKSKLTSTHNGKAFWFCAPGCKKTFDSNPARYAK